MKVDDGRNVCETLDEVKYINYIGDCDTKTFKALLDSKTYGELPITKKSALDM